MSKKNTGAFPEAVARRAAKIEIVDMTAGKPYADDEVTKVAASAAYATGGSVL